MPIGRSWRISEPSCQSHHAAHIVVEPSDIYVVFSSKSMGGVPFTLLLSRVPAKQPIQIYWRSVPLFSGRWIHLRGIPLICSIVEGVPKLARGGSHHIASEETTEGQTWATSNKTKR